ncbi:MAG: hypothetical protein AB8G26_01595 [Ilumatobacter sp.]
MTSTPPSTSLAHRRRTASVLVVLALVSAACGGGSDGDSAPATEVTQPPPTTEVAPATTAPVVTDPPATDAPTTAPPVETPTGSPQAFCDASRDYAIAVGSIDFYDGDDNEGAQRSFTAMQTRVQVAIDAAPDDGAAAPAVEARTLLNEIVPTLEQIAFDPDRFGDLDDGGTRIGALIGDFTASTDRLNFFLTDQCGLVTSDLERDARSFAAANSTLPLQGEGGPTSTEPAPIEPPPTGDSIDISDDTGTISLTVPSEWNDIDGTPGPTENRLVASSNTQTFLNGFSLPGMFIESVDTPTGNGADVYPVALDTIVANYEGGGCSDTVREPYADVAYTGTEATLQCVPGFDTKVIAGTNSSGDTIFVVAMVLADGDSATRQLIVDTFIVD